MLLLLLLQRGRIHAFVPGSVADGIERHLAVGKVFLIENFTVKDYEASDIFRPFAKEIQIVFDDQTRITQLDEEKVYIDQFVFDLYDLADLEPQAKQRKYLIGSASNYIILFCLFLYFITVNYLLYHFFCSMYKMFLELLWKDQNHSPL